MHLRISRWRLPVSSNHNRTGLPYWSFRRRRDADEFSLIQQAWLIRRRCLSPGLRFAVDTCTLIAEIPWVLMPWCLCGRKVRRFYLSSRSAILKFPSIKSTINNAKSLSASVGLPLHDSPLPWPSGRKSLQNHPLAVLVISCMGGDQFTGWRPRCPLSSPAMLHSSPFMTRKNALSAKSFLIRKNDDNQ